MSKKLWQLENEALETLGFSGTNGSSDRERAVEVVISLLKEINRLAEFLSKANVGFEQYERLYYMEKDKVDKRQDSVETKSEELAALRYFAAHIYRTTTVIEEKWVSQCLKMHQLIDADGNPTPILTGVKE